MIIDIIKALFNYIGSSMSILLIIFILVDTIHVKRLSVSNAIGRIFILTILFIGLLRC